MGERFIQYIYKFARKRNIKFIYLTLFKNKSTSPLICLLSSYGFKKHEKTNKRGEEIWVKVLNFNHNNSPKENYPLNLCGLQNDRKIFWLPIESIYHNKLIGFDAESKKLDKKFDDRASVYTIKNITLQIAMKIS